MSGGVFGPIVGATKQVSNELSRVWTGRQTSEPESAKAETFRNLLRILEAVLFLGALFVLVRFVFAYLLKLG